MSVNYVSFRCCHRFLLLLVLGCVALDTVYCLHSVRNVDVALGSEYTVQYCMLEFDLHLLQLIFCFHPVSVDCDQLALHAVCYDSGDHGSTVVKVLCYKSEGHWFNPSWCQWIFY